MGNSDQHSKQKQLYLMRFLNAPIISAIVVTLLSAWIYYVTDVTKRELTTVQLQIASFKNSENKKLFWDHFYDYFKEQLQYQTKFKLLANSVKNSYSKGLLAYNNLTSIPGENDNKLSIINNLGKSGYFHEFSLMKNELILWILSNKAFFAQYDSDAKALNIKGWLQFKEKMLLQCEVILNLSSFMDKQHIEQIMQEGKSKFIINQINEVVKSTQVINENLTSYVNNLLNNNIRPEFPDL